METLIGLFVAAAGGFVAGWLVGRKWNAVVEDKAKKVRDALK